MSTELELEMGTVEPSMWVRVVCTNALGMAYEHDGIVVAVSDPMDATRISVAHFARPEAAGRLEIMETTLAAFLAMGADARVVTHPSDFTAEEVVGRARSQLGRADYNLLGRNCQHFAHWCYHGSPSFSRQVSAFGLNTIMLGLGIVIGGVLTMHASRGRMW